MSMNPLLHIPNLPPGKFRVGQRVRFKHLWRGKIGEVVEDRGPIGRRGRRLYAVRFRPDPWNEFIVERPEESLEAVDVPEAIPSADGKEA
jgi:hypothetical protein